MKQAWTWLIVMAALLHLCTPAGATEPKPAWNQVSEAPQFFRSKGFAFEVDELPKHLYRKKTIELIVLIPNSFAHDGMTNTFSNALVSNEEIAVDVQTWPYKGKRRAIITISEAVAQSTEISFYYKNANGETTDGTQYVVKISQVLESIKNGKAPPGH